MIFYHFCTHFGHFGWLPYWNVKKWIKQKSFASSIPIWSVVPIFEFSVRKGFKMTKNWQKNIPKKVAKKSQKMHAHFHAPYVQARTCMCTNIINQLRKPILTFAESWWCSDLVWLRYWGVLPGNTFGDTQTDKQTNRQTLLKFNIDI